MPLTSSERPRLKAPPGTTDTHMHIYDRRFPTAPTAAFTRPDASVADYKAMCAQLGIARTVVVQATTYGSDNRLAEESIAALGRDKARGIAMLDRNVTGAEIERLSKAGFCGVRMQMFPGGILGWDALEDVARRVAPFGWHAILQFDGRDMPAREATVKRLADILTLVIDHTGKFMEPVSTDHPAFVALLRLVETGRYYVKLAGPYETSKVGAPAYEDVGVLAKVLVRTAPERTMWASNWPWVNPPRGIQPDATELLDLLLDWAPDESTRRKILVDNPARLYGFS